MIELLLIVDDAVIKQAAHRTILQRQLVQDSTASSKMPIGGKEKHHGLPHCGGLA